MTSYTNPFLTEFDTPYKSIPFHRIKIEHYVPAFDFALAEGKQEIEQIIQNTEAPNFFNTVEALEQVGKRLNTICNTLFNLDGAETCEALQDIVEQISPALTAFGNDIMLNTQLFARVKKVHENQDYKQLSSEQQKLLEKTLNNFIRNGAHLSDDEKLQYRTITEELSLTQIRFGKNILEETNKYELHITREELLDGLPESEKEAAHLIAKSKNKEGWMITLSAPSYIPFMQYATQRALRKTLYLQYNTKGCKSDELDNKQNVIRTINLQLQRAQLLGYATYADFVLEKRMANTPSEVHQLLDQLLDAYTPQAQKEYDEINAFAKYLGLDDDVQPWDWSFYCEKFKQAKFNFSEEDTKPYFELNKVKQGVFNLAHRLYGISFVANKDIPVYHEEVEVFEVLDKDQTFLGLVYTDFHPRKGKQGGAWMTNYVEQEKGIRPHVSIVMNFTRPTESTPALLTFREVQTFLHEFGHALHGLFANTCYASLSGTNVYRDFVELPSQIMENWASEKEFLDEFATHYLTGAPLPAELIAKIKQSETFLVGNSGLRQLNFGYLDMAWYSINTPFVGNVIDFETEIGKKTRILPLVKNTCLSTQFSHIFSGGYAAGYYSYKWAEVLEADAFSIFQESGIFNTHTAQLFRKNILELGGTENPMELYIKFRGQKPNIDALLKRSGIINE